MKLKRLEYGFSVALNAHLFNPLWRSRLERRRFRGRAIRKSAGRYLSEYVKAQVPEDTPPHDEPRRVFSIWLQGESSAPGLVKSCLESIRRNAGCEVIVLDKDSIFDWISLPERIVNLWKDGRMKAAHFVDICRIELLYQYGGVWMDATDYLPAPLPEWLWKVDFFVYDAGDTLKGSYAFIQNCFIRGAKGAYLLKVWMEAVFSYWAAETSAVDYFVHQLLFGFALENNPRASELFAAMPHYSQVPTHVLWHECSGEPFTPERFESICSKAIFQKTDYKSPDALNPKPGSIAEHILKRHVRRLFLFAFYDAQGIVGETDLYYLNELKKLGDVSFAADTSLSECEKSKLDGIRLAFAAPHGEYDFGSYKRAFQGPELDDYDYVYLVNDSVVGPLYVLEPYLLRMEASGDEAFGLGWRPSRKHGHLQSWFIGLGPEVFRSHWFSAFLESVRPLGSKDEICTLYEIGLTKLLKEHGISFSGLFSLKGKSIYNAPLRLYRMGFPFIKKASFIRHQGDMGRELAMVMDHIEPALNQAVTSDFDRLEGEGYMKRLLSRSRITMARRYLLYLKDKLLH